MMRPHQFLIGGVGMAVLIAGYSLLPRPEEHATMLARDGLYEAAAKELSSLESTGERRPDILIQTHLLREKQGDHMGALSALEAYLMVRPADFAAREKQADLLLQSGLLDRYLKAQAILINMRPTPERLTWLLEFDRLHGRFDDELALLQDFAGTKYLTYAQHERLGAILAGRGDLEGAERSLLRADQGAPPEASPGRLILLDVLLERGRMEEAYRRARAWMREWRSPYLSGKLILRMAAAGQGAPVSELARDCVDVMPEHVFDVAGVVTRKGRAAVSRQMLARWSERESRPSGDQLRDYVYASRQAGDAEGPFRKLAQLVRDGADPAVQARMAEELAHGYGNPALAPLRPLLTTQVLSTRPLFAAELALFEGNRHLASWFLAQADPGRLAPGERAPWLALLQKVETGEVVFDRLSGLWNEKRLPPELLGPFAQEARRQGRQTLHDAVWASIARQ